MAEKLVRSIIGVLLPPLMVLMEKGCHMEFWIDLLLTILLVWIGGIIYAFHVIGVDLCKNVAAVLLPPLAAFLHLGLKTEFWICLILTLLGWLPGMIYAYYVIQSA
jgi:uncharacterized membrane protein YqaE (UPF0057 family)